MARTTRWLIIVGLLAFIYWSASSSNGVGHSSGDRDWREDVGGLVLLVVGVLSIVTGGLGILRRRRRFTDPGPTTEVSFSTPVMHFALMTIISILGSVATYLLFSAQHTTSSVVILACMSALMTLLAALFLALRFVSGPAKLSLSPLGLSYGPFKCGPIEWRDIRAARAVPFGGPGIISLEIVDPEKYFARGFPKFGRNLGRWIKAFASPFVISPAWLQAPRDLVLDAINVRLAMFGRAETTKDNS